MMWKSVPMFICLTAAIALLAGPRGAAAALDVKVEVPYLRTIQTNTPGEGKSDEIYLLVTGVAKGEAVAKQFPEGKTWKSSPKAPGVTPASTVALWEGKLEEGQYIALTIAAFAGETAGKSDQAKVKDYFEKKAASDKKIEALAGKIGDAKALEEARKAANKQNAAFFKAIGDVFPHRKGDSYVGAFDLIVVNVGGAIHKRIMPTGLLAGEHYGIKVKQYTKIKYTRENVLTKDSSGQFYEQQMEPLGENEETVRIKMTEVEKIGDKRTVTDYLTDVRILVGGKPIKFVLAGDKPGPTIVHDYWDWVE
jgi:hypothetical protein